MSFGDTYSNEVLESRRTRSQRARFWGKVVSILLMLTIAVTLRTEPQLRRALVEAAMTAAMQVSGRSQPTTSSDFAPAFYPIPTSAQEPATSTGVRDRIKVNRPGFGSGPSSTQIDMQSIAQDVQERLLSHGLNGG